MNFVEMYVRVFAARIQEFIRARIIDDDPAPEYSRLDEMDRK